jgi:hypothetical protein
MGVSGEVGEHRLDRRSRLRRGGECGGLWLRRCACRGGSARSTGAGGGAALAGCRRLGAGDGGVCRAGSRVEPSTATRSRI